MKKLERCREGEYGHCTTFSRSGQNMHISTRRVAAVFYIFSYFCRYLNLPSRELILVKGLPVISILTEIFSELAQHCATLCKDVQLSQVDKLTTKPAMYRILQVHTLQFGNPSSIYSRKFCTSLQGILTLFKHFRTIFI